MANTYRATRALDLAAEREAAALRGATVALMVVAAFSVADLLIAGGEYLFVYAKRVGAPTYVRIAFPGVVYVLFTVGGILAVRRASRVARPSWVPVIVLACVALAAAAASIGLGRMMVELIPQSDLLEWTKDLALVIRANALFRPISLAALLVYSGARWIRSANRPTTLDCPSCGAPLETR